MSTHSDLAQKLYNAMYERAVRINATVVAYGESYLSPEDLAIWESVKKQVEQENRSE